MAERVLPGFWRVIDCGATSAQVQEESGATPFAPGELSVGGVERLMRLSLSTNAVDGSNITFLGTTGNDQNPA